LGFLDKIRKKIMGDCPTELIPLIGKPKRWREGASMVLIEFDHRLKKLELTSYAIIGLLVTMLSIIIKAQLGV